MHYTLSDQHVFYWRTRLTQHMQYLWCEFSLDTSHRAWLRVSVVKFKVLHGWSQLYNTYLVTSARGYQTALAQYWLLMVHPELSVLYRTQGRQGLCSSTIGVWRNMERAFDLAQQHIDRSCIAVSCCASDRKEIGFFPHDLYPTLI